MPRYFEALRKRENPLESGLYFLFLDYFNKIANPELSQLLIDYDLALHCSKTEKSGREAFFLNFGNKPGCHLTIDCKYYDEFTDINQRMKWHYCHYTNDSSTEEIIHVYFNQLGQIILCNVTDKNTGISTEVSVESLQHIVLDLELASCIVAQMLAIKSAIVNKARIESEQVFSQAYSFISKPEAFKDLDTELNKNLAEYLRLTELATRYADAYLYFPTSFLKNILQTAKATHAKQLQAKYEKEEDDYGDEVVEVLVTAALPEPKAGAISPQQTAQQTFQRLLTEIKELRGLDDIKLFSKIYRIDEIKHEVIELMATLDYKQQIQALQLLESLASFDITQNINRLLNPRTVTLKILEQHFNLAETYIPRKFYIAMINMAILSQETAVINDYVGMCDFLHAHSAEYVAFINNAKNAQGESTKSFSVSSLELCFDKNNTAAFEMLLRHGVNLGANSQTSKADIANIHISLFKHLFIYFAKAYKATNIFLDKEQAQSITQKIVTFLNIMFDPRFKAGFEFENSLHGRLNKTLLEARYQATIKILSFAAKNSSRGKVVRNESSMLDQAGFFSILDIALKFNLPHAIIEAIGRNITPADTDLKCLAKYFAQFLTDNQFAIVINENQDCAVKIICPAPTNLDDTLSHIQDRWTNASDLTPLNPCIYVLPGDQYEGNQHTANAINILRGLTIAKINSSSYKELQQAVKSFLDRRRDTAYIGYQAYKDAVTDYFGALLMLMNSKPNYRTFILHYTLLFELLLKLGQESLKNSPAERAIGISYMFHANTIYKAATRLESRGLEESIQAVNGFDSALLADFAESFTQGLSPTPAATSRKNHLRTR